MVSRAVGSRRRSAWTIGVGLLAALTGCSNAAPPEVIPEDSFVSACGKLEGIDPSGNVDSRAFGCVVNADGSIVDLGLRLSSGTRPAIAPDRRSFATSSTDGLMVVTATGKVTATVATGATAVDWLDPATVIAVPYGTPNNVVVTWSPGDSAVESHTLSGLGDAELAGRLSLSPDSIQAVVDIRYHDGRTGLGVIDLATWTVTPLIDAPAEFPVSDPAWSPDGERIAFIRATGSLYLLDLASNDEVAVARAVVWIATPSWSADGSTLGYNGQDGVFTVDVTTDTIGEPTAVFNLVTDTSDVHPAPNRAAVLS